MDADPDITLDGLLCFQAYALNHGFNRFYQQAFADTGFTYPKLVILLALEEREPLSVSDLSERVGVEANSLSPLLKKMADAGVITRDRAIEDERKLVIQMTDFGKRLLKQSKAVVHENWAALGLDPEEVQNAVRLMSDLRQKLGSAKVAKLVLPEVGTA